MMDAEPDTDLLADPLEIEMLTYALALNWGGVKLLLNRFAVPAPFMGQLTGAGDIGRARVAVRGSLWEPEGDTPSLILAVRERGELVDLLACSSAHPDRWALRRGMGWVLGHDHYFACQAEQSDRLRLFATPLDWLAAGGDGICVLEWGAAALGWLRGLGPRVAISCDPDAGTKLRDMLAHGGLPRVQERSGEQAAA